MGYMTMWLNGIGLSYALPSFCKAALIALQHWHTWMSNILKPLGWRMPKIAANSFIWCSTLKWHPMSQWQQKPMPSWHKWLAWIVAMAVVMVAAALTVEEDFVSIWINTWQCSQIWRCLPFVWHGCKQRDRCNNNKNSSCSSIIARTVW